VVNLCYNVIMKTNFVVLTLCIVFGVVLAEINVDDIAPVPMHSFRPPFSTGRVGIRWWNYGGSVTVFQNYIRLTQDIQSQVGYIWNKNPVTFSDWEATVSLKIDGKGRLGGDGIAFWYSEPANVKGGAFGSFEQWKGLGVFIDTFDNDNKHDNPYISVIVNDGTKVYDPNTDGKDIQVGGCRAALRKTSGTALLRVTYRGSTKRIQVSYDASGNGHFHECYSGFADLPTGYYLGLSAATGGVSDNHDVYYFELRRLDGGDPNVKPSPSTNGNNNNNNNNVKTPEQKEQEEKTEKELHALKQELEELRKVNAASQEANKKPNTVPPTDVKGRVAALEEQIKQMESKLNAINKVAGGIEAIASTIEQLKQRVDKNGNPSSFDSNQFKYELSKQQQEVSRIASKAHETIASTVESRMASLEKKIRDLRSDMEDVFDVQTKNGSGSGMKIVMIVIMVAESCLILYMFLKGRRVNNKYDKMW